MVYARTRQAASALSRAVQAGNLQKEYLALIHGCPSPACRYLGGPALEGQRQNKVFVVRRMRKGVKAAKLAYRVLEEATPLTLVHIRLYTGRSHQIRVQFASRGFPLAGDHKYGSRDDIRSPPSGPSASPCPIPSPVKPSPACIHRRGSCGTRFP